jgi:hypothetical protein
MIRIERVILPNGLRAIARRDENGDLVIYVSNALDAGRQRAAVMTAVRASRRAGWRAALPVGVALLAGLRLWLGRAATAIHARPAAWAASAVAVTAGVVAGGALLLTPPHPHSPVASGQPPAGASLSPPHQQQGVPGHHRRRVQPVAATPGTSPGLPGGLAQAGQTSPMPGQPGPTAPGPGRTASPRPSQTPPAPAPSTSPPSVPSPGPSPSPTPAPAPSGGKPGTCVILLGVRVCVPLQIAVLLKV